jgi:hypothetical protein
MDGIARQAIDPAIASFYEQTPEEDRWPAWWRPSRPWWELARICCWSLSVPRLDPRLDRHTAGERMPRSVNLL